MFAAGLARVRVLVVRVGDIPDVCGFPVLFDTCKNVLDEFNTYRYDPEKPKEEPIKLNDHCMDARAAWTCPYRSCHSQKCVWWGRWKTLGR